MFTFGGAEVPHILSSFSQHNIQGLLHKIGSYVLFRHSFIDIICTLQHFSPATMTGDVFHTSPGRGWQLKKNI